MNFEKASKRTCLDIATVNSAIKIVLAGNRITACSLAIGGVAPVSKAITSAEAFLRGKEVSPKTVRAVLPIVQQEISPISDVRGSAGYKRLLANHMVIAHFSQLFPQAMVAMECAIAKAAETMGKTREELQRRNLLREDDRFPYGQPAERCNANRTWDASWSLTQAREDLDKFNQTHPLVKRGMAVMPVCFGISFTKTFLNQAGALVLVYTDGSVSVANGGVEMGQGNRTSFRLPHLRSCCHHGET